MAATRYIEAVGRRKTATARVRIFEASKESFDVNGRDLPSYFPTRELQAVVLNTFKIAHLPKKFGVTAKVQGGGIRAQSEAVQHGIARALVAYDAELRRPLKHAGYLKRDPRVKERKKPGLKGARRAAQWSKR